MKLLAGVPFFEFRRSDKILLYSRERRTALLFHGLVNAGDGALATAIEAVFQRSAFLNHLFAREPVLPKLTTRSAYLAANVEIELNDACQLGCIYCFSEASACKGSMSRERANAAIDLAFRNAVAQRAVTGTAPIVQLGFTGGGDPFFDPKLALACFEHAKEMSERHDVDYSLSLQTNGQWSPGLAKRLPRYKIGTVCLSMDGLQGVQDLQRPRQDGASSFDRCRRTLDELL